MLKLLKLFVVITLGYLIVMMFWDIADVGIDFINTWYILAYASGIYLIEKKK